MPSEKKETEAEVLKRNQMQDFVIDGINKFKELPEEEKEHRVEDQAQPDAAIIEAQIEELRQNSSETLLTKIELNSINAKIA